MNTMRVVPGHSVLPYFCRRVVPGSHLHNERDLSEAKKRVGTDGSGVLRLC